jgi:hypothetical protein
MKKLSIEQMESTNGGSLRKIVECAGASIGLAAATVGLLGLTVASGGLVIAAAAVGFSVAPALWGLACFA